MAHSAVVVFTARPLEEILRDRGSRDWRLDPARARRAEYLVCTQNRHNVDFGAPTAPHGAAFLIGRVAGVVESPERHDRWLIKISQYVACDLPNIWGKSGHLRYPVWYTTLEDLGIDLATLPPFRPIGLAEVQAPLSIPHANGGQDLARLDAILSQLDRIPDAPAPFQPLSWDEHGLPR